MATLNYKIPGGVLSAYGKALTPIATPSLTDVFKPVQDMAAGMLEAKIEKEKALNKLEAEKKATLSKSQDSFYKSIEKYNGQGTNFNPEVMSDFETRFITPLADAHDDAAIAENKEGARTARANAKNVSKSLKTLSGSTNQIVLNEDLFDEESFPLGVHDKMAAILDMKANGTTLEVNSDTNEVYYSIPQDGGDPIMVTNADIEKWNVEFLLPTDEAGKLKKIFTGAGPSSKRGDWEQIQANLLGDISDIITRKNVRSMVLNKDVWGGRDEESRAQSFADQFKQQNLTFELRLPSSASAEMLALDGIDGDEPDGILTPEEMTSEEMTSGDMDAILELMLHRDNFDVAKDELVRYAKGRMDRQVKSYKGEDTASNNETNTNYA